MFRGILSADIRKESIMGNRVSIKKIKKGPVRLSKNNVISFKAKSINIDCLSGALWITWQNNSEKTLLSGQAIKVSSKGKVCIFAFSDSFLSIQ